VITAQSADGVLHQFPDGTDDSIIDKAMKDYAAQPSPSPPSPPPPSGGSLWQRLTVSPQRQANIEAGLNENASDKSGSTMAAETLKGVPLAGAAVPQTQEMTDFEQAHPWGSKALQFGGGAVATAPLFGAAGGATLGAIGRAAGLSGALSGADVGVRQLKDTGSINWPQVGLGAGVGALGGATGTLAGAAIGKGIGAITDAITSRWTNQGVLAGIDKLAVSHAADAAKAAGLTDAQITAKAAQLGPDGFLGEYAPEFTGQAGAIASKPGPGAGIVRDAFTARAAQQTPRIEQAVTDAMGPRLDLYAVNAQREANQKAAASGLYTAFRSQPIQPSPEIDALMPRLKASGAMAAAHTKMAIQGEPSANIYFKPDPINPQQMTLDTQQVPTATTFDYMKRALSDKIGIAQRQGADNDVRILTGLKNDLVNAVDAQSPVWKQARNAWGAHEDIRNATEAGQQLFQRSTRFDEFAHDLRTLSKPEVEAMWQGARDTVAETMDATHRGSTRAMDLFQAPAAQNKLRLLLQTAHGVDTGNAKTDALIQAVNRERGFAQSKSDIIHGPETARRLQYGQKLEPQPGILGALSHEYSPHVTPLRALQLTGLPQREEAGIAQRNEAMRGALAQMLTARGQQAAAYARALASHQPPSGMIAPLAQRLGFGAGMNLPPTIMRGQQ
jgi:hypothetical protein